MTGIQVEYIGFTAKATVREYTLRVRRAGEIHDFTLAIPNVAFLTHLVRYQDGPDICFLKLQRELTTCGSVLPAFRLNVSDGELEEYRVAHAPKPSQRHAKPPPRP